MAIAPKLSAHSHACDCAAHRVALRPSEAKASVWASVLPILLCAVCPACLTTYAKLFSVLGIGLGMSEVQHMVLLGVALSASVALSAFRTFRSGRSWPLATALTGAGLVLLGHLGGELHLLEWAGVLVLFVGGLREHFRLRRLSSATGDASADQAGARAAG